MSEDEEITEDAMVDLGDDADFADDIELGLDDDLLVDEGISLEIESSEID